MTAGLSSASAGMAGRAHALDWGATALGARAGWPQSLETLVAVLMAAKQPMFLAWGAERVWFYNDAFVPILGNKHPGALGQPSSRVWAEAWSTLSPLFDRVFGGEAVHMEGFTVGLDRDGKVEDATFDFSYTPAPSDDGAITGLFGVCTETTARVAAERSEAEAVARQRRQFQQSPGFVIVMSGAQHVVDFVNDKHRQVFGSAGWIGQPIREAFPSIEGQGYFERLDEVYATGKLFEADRAEVRFQRDDGSEPSTRFLSFVYAPVFNDEGAVTGIFCDGFDVTTSVMAERALRLGDVRQHVLADLAERFRDLDEAADLSFAAAETLGRALGVSRAGYGTVDLNAETITIERDWNAPGIASLAGVLQFRDYGSYIDDLKRGATAVVSDARTDTRTAATADALVAISAQSFVNMPVTEQGGFVALLYLNHAQQREWRADELTLIREVAERTRDAVQRRRAEEDLRQLAASLEHQVVVRKRELEAAHEALRRSQKMEAVGQLTGGIAHDFNNLLAAISGSLELLSRRNAAAQFEGIDRYISTAQGATRRAAALTHRLLAFSRQQTLDPRPTDVNRLVAGMEDLIRRSVGPDIELEVVGAGGLWVTKIDPSQLENSVLNLCINARDAMAPRGGRLTIETANKWLDERAAKERDLPPGQYVSVCITDTGVGMSPEIAERAFDPFFTTKPLGEGTGLGLSMVYGFVRQSGGQVRVYSEPGQGTTMCLYLPRHLGRIEMAAEAAAAPAVKGDGACVLVIDDEQTIRMLIVEVLEESGYTALEAGDGAQGLRILRGDTRVDLLITDVGLPGGMNGRQVADAARALRPGLKVLFITGYAENAAIGNGLLEPGMAVMTKPFEMSTLAMRVQEMTEQ